jgi:hypothetical protein
MIGEREIDVLCLQKMRRAELAWLVKNKNNSHGPALRQ